MYGEVPHSDGMEVRIINDPDFNAGSNPDDQVIIIRTPEQNYHETAYYLYAIPEMSNAFTLMSFTANGEKDPENGVFLRDAQKRIHIRPGDYTIQVIGIHDVPSMTNTDIKALNLQVTDVEELSEKYRIDTVTKKFTVTPAKGDITLFDP